MAALRNGIAREERAREQACAELLVHALCAWHRLPLILLAVQVARNWKITFTFRALPEGPSPRVGSVRYGRRPGLEIHWEAGGGDVDAWQFDGDVVSLVTHGFWQILKEKITGRAERPSKLLAIFEQQEKTKGEFLT